MCEAVGGVCVCVDVVWVNVYGCVCGLSCSVCVVVGLIPMRTKTNALKMH